MSRASGGRRSSTLVWRAGQDLPPLTTSSDVGLLVSQFPATLDEGLMEKLLREGETTLEQLEVDGHPGVLDHRRRAHPLVPAGRRRGGRDVRPAGRRHARARGRRDDRADRDERWPRPGDRDRGIAALREPAAAGRCTSDTRPASGDHPWLVGASPGSPAPHCSSAGSCRPSLPAPRPPAAAAMRSWNATPPNPRCA